MEKRFLWQDERRIWVIMPVFFFFSDCVCVERREYKTERDLKHI